MLNDTIAAIATPLGEGGLSVIRVSGTQAISIVDRSFQSAARQAVPLAQAPSHTVHYGYVVRNHRRIDEVLVTVLRAPRTYTREDVVEISCHGGIVVTKSVLESVLASGARLADAGEFTRRAFLNGRIDLAQAEAVADMIHSRTELALSAANEQLAGHLSKKINELRDTLMRVLAHVEAHIDFPDEDISPDTREQLIARLAEASSFMKQLLSTANEGQILRKGIRAAIVGRPNAGKSSLLNCLLGRDRAIVSPIAGTTRDTIEETANIRGIPVVFIDTAGLRDSTDALEREGVRRSRETLERAELILLVIDGSEPSSELELSSIEDLGNRKHLRIRNKCDLPSSQSLAVRGSGELEVSCVTGQGVELLKDAIRDLVWSGEIRSEMFQVMINSRHQNALERALQATDTANEALKTNAGLELVAMDLRMAAGAVGEVVGKTTTEDLLDSIFSQFCIGK